MNIDAHASEILRRLRRRSAPITERQRWRGTLVLLRPVGKTVNRHGQGRAMPVDPPPHVDPRTFNLPRAA